MFNKIGAQPQQFYDAAIKSLGDHYRPQDSYDHGEWKLVAALEAESEDGKACRVYESRWPARFFKVMVDPGSNWNGRPQAGVRISTGSGQEMGELAGSLAIAISQGMVTVEVYCRAN
jgi:hypothetical protein